ncbi:MAG: hypothetical protein WBZ31_05105 [Thiobacillus sp.]
MKITRPQWNTSCGGEKEEIKGAAMTQIGLLDIVIGFVLTWIFGLLPPYFIRFKILKRPMNVWPAVGVCILLWITGLVFWEALGSHSTTHGAVMLVSVVSYFVLRSNSSDKGFIRMQKQEQKPKTLNPEDEWPS